MKKLLLKYRYGFLLIFPLLLVIFSLGEADTRFSYDVDRFFSKSDLSKEESMIISLLSEDQSFGISAREKKELARAIVRYSVRIQIPDGVLLSGYKPLPSLFLLSWAKTRTGMKTSAKKGFGILNLPESFVQEMEAMAGAKIDRKIDIYSYSIQYKLALLKYKEYLSEGNSVESAYSKLYGTSYSDAEWDLFEKNYKTYAEKITYENKP
ncbi:MAG: hypothetical protein O9301_03720 [Leptospira sp.]|nr:hypothetical protein [Leptospira sp.]